MVSPAVPHDGTPLLQPPALRHGPSSSSTPRPSGSSAASSPSPSSISSSSSSVTVTGVPPAQALSEPARLRAPLTQEPQGLTPPPAYASLGISGPPNPWAYNGGAQPDDATPPPAFGLFGAGPTPAAGTPAHQFGPTPLGRAATIPYAAYIEAPGAPDARAWRRFVGALGLALALFVLFGVGFGLEVVGEGGWVNLELWGRDSEG